MTQEEIRDKMVPAYGPLGALWILQQCPAEVLKKAIVALRKSLKEKRS
jgi:hypothetical protein